MLKQERRRASQVVQVVRNLFASAGEVRDAGLNAGSGRSPGGGHGHPLRYSCLGNPMDRGARQATVHGVARGGQDLATKQHPDSSKVKMGCLQ